MKRTAAGLREVLFEQIDGLRSGRVSATDAKAVATVAATILKSVEVEMQFRAQAAEIKDGSAELGSLPLADLPEAPPALTEPPPARRIVRGRDMRDD